MIVTYNSANHIGKLLDSLQPFDATSDGSTQIHVLVVDNASTDSTVPAVTQRPWVELIRSTVNLGYGGGINLARHHSDPKWPIVVLNPDLELDLHSLRHLIVIASSSGAGVTAPMILNRAGQVYPSMRFEPTVLRALGDAMFGARWPGRPPWLRETEYDPVRYETSADADWVSGAVLAISTECATGVGDWDDQRFFLYSEETDFCHRARAQGFRVRYDPRARAIHDEGGSGRSPQTSALMAISRHRYFRKYHGRIHTIMYWLVLLLHHFLRSVRFSSRLTISTLIRHPGSGTVPFDPRIEAGRAHV